MPPLRGLPFAAIIRPPHRPRVSAVGSVISSTRGGSLQFQNSLQRNNANAQRALERLSTGKRINRPSDDPSGFVGAEELRGEIARLEGELKGIPRAAYRSASKNPASARFRIS
jgi:hypothetical protein